MTTFPTITPAELRVKVASIKNGATVHFLNQTTIQIAGRRYTVSSVGKVMDFCITEGIKMSTANYQLG